MLRRRIPQGFAILILAALAACGSSEGESFSGDRQESAVADGLVTEAEYFAAIQAQRDCLHQAGYTTTEPKRDKQGILWKFGTRSSTVDQDVAARQQEKCYSETAQRVERIYFFAHVPTGAKRDAQFADLIRCLRDAGVVGVNATMGEAQIVKAIADQLPADMSEGLWCIEENSALFPDGRFPS